MTNEDKLVTNKETYSIIANGYGSNSCFTKLKKGETVIVMYNYPIDNKINMEREKLKLEDELDDIMYVKPVALVKKLTKRLKYVNRNYKF